MSVDEARNELLEHVDHCARETFDGFQQRLCRGLADGMIDRLILEVEIDLLSGIECEFRCKSWDDDPDDDSWEAYCPTHNKLNELLTARKELAQVAV